MAVCTTADADGAPTHLWCFVAGALGMNLGLTVVGNLVFAVIYAAHVPALEAYKINADVPWPWLSPSADTRDRFWALIPRSVVRVLLNNAMTVPALMTTFPLSSAIGAFDVSAAGFPDAWTLVWQLAVCTVVEDAMFYVSHRTLHRKDLYPYIHKIHHEYNHPITLASEHAHPVEFFVGNLLPVIAGPLLLRVHMYTLYAWVLVRIAVSIDEHSGYAFPWSPVRLLPFGATAEGHDYHHTHNDGVYASEFEVWDRAGGTTGKFTEWRRAAFARLASGGGGGGGSGKQGKKAA